jgi:hypothetical protein
MALLSKNAKSLPLDLLKTKKSDREPWRLKKILQSTNPRADY